MPFRSSRVQSRIMEREPSPSRPFLDTHFLNLPSPFHSTSNGTVHTPDSAISPYTDYPPINNTQASQSKRFTSPSNVHSRASAWWKILSSSSSRTNPISTVNSTIQLNASTPRKQERESGEEGDDGDDGVLYQAQDSKDVRSEERRKIMKVVLETAALLGLAISLVGFLVFCARAGAGRVGIIE